MIIKKAAIFKRNYIEDYIYSSTNSYIIWTISAIVKKLLPVLYVIVANNFEVDYVNFEKIIKALKEWSIIMEWFQHFLVIFAKNIVCICLNYLKKCPNFHLCNC